MRLELRLAPAIGCAQKIIGLTLLAYLEQPITYTLTGWRVASIAAYKPQLKQAQVKMTKKYARP